MQYRVTPFLIKVINIFNAILFFYGNTGIIGCTISCVCLHTNWNYQEVFLQKRSDFTCTLYSHCDGVAVPLYFFHIGERTK